MTTTDQQERVARSQRSNLEKWLATFGRSNRGALDPRLRSAIRAGLRSLIEGLQAEIADSGRRRIPSRREP